MGRALPDDGSRRFRNGVWADLRGPPRRRSLSQWGDAVLPGAPRGEDRSDTGAGPAADAAPGERAGPRAQSGLPRRPDPALSLQRRSVPGARPGEPRRSADRAAPECPVATVAPDAVVAGDAPLALHRAPQPADAPRAAPRRRALGAQRLPARCGLGGSVQQPRASRAPSPVAVRYRQRRGRAPQGAAGRTASRASSGSRGLSAAARRYSAEAS